MGTHTHGARAFVQAVVLPVAVPLAAGSLAGAFLGAKAGSLIPEDRLKQFFFLCMVLLGGRNVVGAFSKMMRPA